MSDDSRLFRPTPSALAAMFVFLGTGPGLMAAPDITATKDDGVAAGVQMPAGSTITYENTISNGTAPGTTDATGVQFIDPEVANTAYVADSLTATPVAIDDTYPVTVIANTSIDTATSGFSVITNDFAGFSGGVAVLNSALTITNVTAPANGAVSMTLSGTGVGQFVYTPTPGYVGADSFSYEISNGVSGGTTVSRTGTVNLTVGGPVIWFVAPAMASNGTGILGNPFNNLAAAVTAIGANTNHRIFIYSGGAAQATGTTLNSGGWLVGQAAVGTTFEALMGGIVYPGDTTAARPSINHPTKPSLTRSAGNTLTLGENNVILGVAIGNTGGGFAISGSNINVGQIGNAITSDVDLSSGGSSSGAISINGGNGNIAINAPVSTTFGNSVSITNRTGGIVSFLKAISDTGRGISLTNNGGGSGATIAFTGGLALSTGTFPAFTATGGGKVSATQNNTSVVNTIATGTGTALNVTNTTIDTPGLTFRSIAANGSSNGIVLNNTGALAGLTVIANATLNSGGIIQNTTGDGIILISTQSPSFDRMRIQDAGGQGISGLTVNGLTLKNTTIIGAGNGDEENGIILGSAVGSDNGITGTVLIQDVVIDAPEQWGLRVRNAAAGSLNMTLQRLTVQNNTGTFGEDAVSIRIEGGTSTVLVDDCDFIDTGGKGVDGQCGGNSGASLHMTVQNSQFLRNLALPFATSFTTQGNASGRFLGSGNTATSSTTDITSSMAFDFDASDTSTLDATMTNNTANVTFGTGLEFVVNDDADGRIAATGNTINLDPGSVNAAAQQGMNFHARSVLTASSTGQLDVTLGNNTITGITSAIFGFAGFNFQSGSSAGTHAQIISLNVASGAGANSVSGTAGSAFNLRQRTGTTFRVTGLATPGTVEGNVEAFIQANNSSGTLGGATDVASAGGSTIVNYTSGATLLPQTPALPLIFAPGGIEKAPAVSSETSAPGDMQTMPAESVSLPGISPESETGIVSQAGLDAVVAAAIARWEETGLTSGQVARLRTMKFEIATLSHNHLGEAGGNTIRVDATAGGNGWFVDASATSDACFGTVKSSTRRHTEPSAVPAGRVDLLTTVMHEMGHALGLADTYNSNDRESLMYGHLSKGERRLPASGQAEGVKSFEGTGTHFLSGALNPIDIGTLPPGKSVVITYQVKINEPFTLGATQISSQGTVHSTTPDFADVLTDDPESGAAGDPTITLLDRPDTTVVSLARAGSTPTNAGSLTWTLTLADPVINLASGNFTLINSGLGGTPAITGVTAVGALPATQWTVDASTGTGDGTLGLNLANDTGLSHDVTNLPFTGEVYAIDRSGPTATIVVADSALAAGETSLVTITFSEAVIGFDNADLTISNGALTSVSSSDGGITWTATLTPTASITDATNVIILDNTGVTDALGNAGTGTTDSNNYAIDTTRPTATIVVADSALAAGETSLVTITFNEAVTGFANADLTVANGTLTAVSSSDGGITWSATFTPTPSVTDATNVITLDNTGVQDGAGNAGTGTTDSNNYAIDTLRPFATVVVADTALAAGETSLVTLTFNEAVSGLTTADLTVANGTVSGMSSSDGGVTWTATLTPNTGVEDNSNLITLDNTGVQDAAGNTGTGTTDSNNYAIDTVRPTASLVVADTALAAGETSLVTISFSEAVTGFTIADLAVANGALSGMSSSDGGITWTATLTPNPGVEDNSNLITLDNTGVQDAAGNTGAGSTDSNNYAIDTARPTAIIVVADTELLIGETSLVTITFSEAVSGFSNADLTVPNGTLSAVSSSDGGITWTATFTPTPNITDATNVITLDNTGVIDAAGNTGTGTTDSNNFAITSLSISIAAATASAAEGTGGGTTAFTFTVSRTGSTVGTVTMDYAVSGVAVDAADFGGSLPSGQFTIPDNQASAVLTINVSQDSTVESDEDFTVTLTNASGGFVIVGASAVSTIINDDFEADLAITVTDGVTTAIPGGLVTYTITASNAGPHPAMGATLVDTFPASLTTTWTAVGAGGGTATAAGSGNINDTVNLPVGGSVTYTVTATISPAATGTLSNTASISSSVTDPVPANNSATDIDTLTPQADLAITKTDGAATATPGNPVTYTIVATNAGPSNVIGATVADSLPAFISGATWTSAGTGGATSTPSGSGNINDTVNLPVGGSVTYTVTATIAASATGTLSNTATIIPPGGTTDPNPGNNSATDTDTLTPIADLAMTMTDAPDPVNAAGNLTYTVILTNQGPSDAVSPSVILPLPASTTFVAAIAPAGWVASTPAVGGIGVVTFSAATLASGETAVFTVVVNVDLTVINDSVLIATATAISPTTDPNPANNSATTTTLAKSGADLQITLADSPDPVVAGTELTYTLDVGNNGPLDADNVSISDTLPPGTTFVSLSAPAGWSAVTPAVGSAGSITLTNLLFANAASATFTLVVKVNSDVVDGALLSNTATISSTTIDIAPGNNSATATTSVTTRSDLVVGITGTPSTAPKGSDVVYEITLANNGPSDASALSVSMPIPAQMTFVSATAPAGWTAVTPAVGSGGTVGFSAASLANGASVSFIIVARVNADAPTGTVLIATVTASALGIDPIVANNTASATAAVGTVNPTALQIGTTGTLNNQSGLFELTVNVTNTTPLPINGFRLHVDFSAYLAAYPSLRLYNATSPVGSSDVYVDYPYPVALDGVVPVKLSFYTSTRTFPSPFAPVLTVETLATSQVPDTNGDGVQPRIVMLPDGTILLEFPSVVGRWYRVRYSSDMVNWSDSPVPLQAGTNRMQWIDSGPPFTNVPPSDVPSRFYIVNEIAAP